MTRAIAAGTTPVPINGIKRNKSPKLGMIRKTWENDEQTRATLGCFEPRYPSGRLISMAITKTEKLSARCWPT